MSGKLTTRVMRTAVVLGAFGLLAGACFTPPPATGTTTTTTTVPPFTCAVGTWCALPKVGDGVDPSSSYIRVGGVDDVGDVVFDTAQDVPLVAANDQPPVDDAFLWRRATNSFTRLSNGMPWTRQPGGGTSGIESISDDGRWVAYDTMPSLGATDYEPQVHLRDTSTGTDTTIPWQPDPNGCKYGEYVDDQPKLAPDGSSVFFTTRCYLDERLHLWQASTGLTTELPLTIQYANITTSGYERITGNDGHGVSGYTYAPGGPTTPDQHDDWYIDFATQQKVPAAVRQHAVPGESSADARYWISEPFDFSEPAPPLTAWPEVADMTTLTQHDLGMPPDYVISAPNTWPSITISGDAHHVAFSDNHTIVVQTI